MRDIYHTLAASRCRRNRRYSSRSVNIQINSFSILAEIIINDIFGMSPPSVDDIQEATDMAAKDLQVIL